MKKILSMLIAIALVIALLPSFAITVSAAEIEAYAEGTLGSSSKTAWTIYSNGLLVIDGKGNSVSTKWDSTTASPWKNYKDVITRVSFTNCENLVRIPECTFRGLSNLKEVTLPDNIEEICEYAFTGTAIETIILPEGLKTIGRFAFGSCQSLNYVNINDGVTSIGSDAFYNCSTLKAVSIPDSVTSIGQNLFKNCTNLEYVRLSENAVTVGSSMFFGCAMLKNVSLPASVTEIGSQSFANASNLEGVYYHGTTEPTTYNPGLNGATFSLAPDTMVIYTSNDYSGTTMGLEASWENDVRNVTKIDGHFVNIAYTANGAVKVSASIVPSGENVTVDIMAYKNYELETITVTGSDGQVELSGSGHSRSFNMPEGDVTINATFKSTVTPHVHDWIYTADGATIKATCVHADTCHNPISKVEISKGNTSSLAFRPGHVKSMTVSGKLEDVEIPDLVYTLKSTGEPAIPINPGVYVASLTVENVTATYEFEITRDRLNYTFFDYYAPQNLTYDGTPKYASVVLHEDYEPYVGEYTVYYNTGTTEPINAGTYTVKVDVEESDYYSKSTGLTMGRQGRFTIAPKSIDDLTYEGLAAGYPVGDTPDVTITYGDMTLVKDTDYTIDYANNTEPGTATMTITGQGNYTGSKTLEYEVSSSVPEEHLHSYENGICSCGALDARALGSSLTLEGSIEISYYFEMAEAIYNNPSAIVRFTFEDGRAPLEISARDGIIDTESVAGKTLYVYGCDVFAKQMTDNVTAQVVLGENKSEEYAHSVRNYAKLLIESNGYSAECVALVKAMLNYGAYAQTHFGYHIERLANDILSESDKVINVDASVFDAYAPNGNANASVGEFVGADLILESETTLDVYFIHAEGKEISDLSFTVDGKAVDVKETSNGYVIAIANIAAQDLDKVYTVTASDGSAESTYEISALSYCTAVMNRETNEIYTDALKDAIKALYLYNDAANKYFGNK